MTFLYGFRHALCAAIAALGLYTLLGFIIAPYVIKAYVVPALAEKFHRPIVLQDVQINPFALSVRLLGLDIQEQDKTSVIGFGELFVNFETVSIIRRTYVFDEIRIVRPFVLVKIRSDGTLNLVGLIPPTEGPPPAPQPKSPIPAAEIGLFHVQSGVVEYRDESKKKPVTLDVVPIELTLHKFSTKPGVENAHSFTAEFGEGETLTWNGTFTLEPLESQGTLALAGIKLAGFWKKIQDQFKFDVRSGDLNVNLKYAFDTLATPLNLRVSDGKVALTDLAVGEKGTAEPLATIGSVTLDGLGLDLAWQTATLGALASTHGRIRGWVQPDGVINYVPLFGSSSDERRTESTGSSVPPDSPSSRAPSRPTKDWSLTAKSVQIDDYGIKLEDRSSQPTAQLSVDDIRFTTKEVHVPFTKPVALHLELKLNQTGQVNARGTVGMNPMQADMKLDISHVALRPFQPYVNKFLQADLGGGEFNLDGRTTYSAVHNDGPRLTFRGNTSIADFEIRDRAAGKPVVSWGSLAVNKVALDLEPTSISIGDIEWRTPSVQAIVDPNGALNLARLTSGAGQSAQPASAPKKKAEPKSGPSPAQVTPVSVGTVKLHKASVSFVDRSVEPAVSTGIHNLSGSIKGLSSKEIARANVSLTGIVDRVAPLKIRGQINPLSGDAYTNLTFTFDDMDLTGVSPYAGKYAGYPIDKGTLHLDLMYKVSQKQLLGENKVIIDQFTFGNSTNSPDATSLPVRLAVALLKDRQGKIAIDLPVRGDLNEPDFRYGRVVLNAVVNLITKIATSPFAALGNLVGGAGEELQYVEFDPGDSTLTETEQRKMQTLHKALSERPALRLEVVGNVDPKVDGRALAEQKVDSAVLDRFRKTNKKSSKVQPTAEREFDLLSELYIERFGKQPMKREETSKGKSVERVMQRDEIKEELVVATEVPEQELRELAQARADEIRQHLVQQGQPEGQIVMSGVELTESGKERVRSRLNLTGA